MTTLGGVGNWSDYGSGQTVRFNPNARAEYDAEQKRLADEAEQRRVEVAEKSKREAAQRQELAAKPFATQRDAFRAFHVASGSYARQQAAIAFAKTLAGGVCSNSAFANRAEIDLVYSKLYSEDMIAFFDHDDGRISTAVSANQAATSKQV